MKALYFEEFGEADVLKFGEVPEPKRSPADAVVEMSAIGLNFADIYRRRGNYHLEGEPPFILGYEGTGIVIEGDDTGIWSPGDRVAFADVPFANAERVCAPSNHLIAVPDDVALDLAAALPLQGLTAHYLTSDSFAIQPGHTVLIHAVAGGVGQLLTQIAKLKGARVLGLTSSESKRQVALEAGADSVVLYDGDWLSRVRDEAPGGVDVAYDSVGITLERSFEATRIGGTVVFFGMAGGDPVPVDPRMLMDTSKTLTGGDLWNVLTSGDERRRRSEELFEWLRTDQIRIGDPTRFALAEGAEAHRLLESRKSTGKILLLA